MKIAITGKGGVGKTTLTSLLAYAYAEKGFQVLAIDADPAPCLADALAFPQELLDELTPIARMDDLIYERSRAQPAAFSRSILAWTTSPTVSRPCIAAYACSKWAPSSWAVRAVSAPRALFCVP